MMMNRALWVMALALIFATFSGRSQVIYSEDFEGSGDGWSNSGQILDECGSKNGRWDVSDHEGAGHPGNISGDYAAIDACGDGNNHFNNIRTVSLTTNTFTGSTGMEICFDYAYDKPTNCSNPQMQAVLYNLTEGTNEALLLYVTIGTYDNLVSESLCTTVSVSDPSDDYQIIISYTANASCDDNGGASVDNIVVTGLCDALDMAVTETCNWDLTQDLDIGVVETYNESAVNIYVNGGLVGSNLTDGQSVTATGYNGGNATIMIESVDNPSTCFFTQVTSDCDRCSNEHTGADACYNAPVVTSSNEIIGSTNCGYSGVRGDPGVSGNFCGNSSTENDQFIAFISDGSTFSVDYTISRAVPLSYAYCDEGVQMAVLTSDCDLTGTDAGKGGTSLDGITSCATGGVSTLNPTETGTWNATDATLVAGET